MIKIKTIITVLLVIILNLLGNKILIGQETYRPSILELKGYVYDGDKKVEGALIELYQNETIVKKIVTKKNAKFEFVLFKDVRYKVRIVKEGYVEEFVIVATKDSPDYSDRKYLFEFSIDLKNLDKYVGLGLTAFEFPSAKISFSLEDDEYTYDRFYHKMIKTRMKKLKLMSEAKLEQQY